MSDNTLYNKYRPSAFDEVVGQSHVVEVIKAHLTNGTLPHSLIFYGPYGTGKTSLARLIARQLNPHSSGLIEKDCVLEANVEWTRGLPMDIEHSPYEGEYKTYIFDEAHEIPNKSFNGLLKTIEEPPSHIKFIFVTSEFNKIPGGVKSRSECHAFSLLSTEDIRQRILEVLKQEGKSISNNLLSVVIDSSRGSLRDALVSLETVLTQTSAGVSEDNIIKTLGSLDFSKLADFILYFLARDFKSLDETVEMFSEEHIDPEKAVSDLQQYVMDVRRAWIYNAINPGQPKEYRTDVQLFMEKARAIGLPSEGVGPSLDKMFDLTIPLLKDLRFVHNKKALLYRFVISLGLTWG